MKVIFYLPFLTQSGGVERALCTLLNEMCLNKSIEVVLLTNYGKKEDSYYELSDCIRVVEIGVKNYQKYYLRILRQLLSIVRREKPDYFVNVETISMLFTFPLMLSRKKRELKYLVWEHFNFLNNNGRVLREWLRKVAARFADGIVTLTNRDLDTWTSNLKIKGKIVAIPNITSFPGLDNAYKVDSRNIIAVGRLTKVKGFDRLIECFKYFIQLNKVEDDWKLSIIGDGELYGDLVELISRHELESRVHIVSHTRNIKSYYENASFVCLTSYNEGLPMVLIEAQSFGLPIIAFDCYTGPSEIVSEQSGILVPDGNIQAYTQALKNLVENPKLRETMAVNARKESYRFSGEEIVLAWETYLKGL